MSQTKRITNYLKKGKSLTALSALRLFNCLRLSGRILEIRKSMKVESEWVTINGKRLVKYHL